MPLTREHVVWAYRILLDREPENDDVIRPKMQAYATTRELRDDIVTSAEYQEKNRDFAQSNERNLVIKPLESGVRVVVDLADHAIGLNILRGRFELNELDFVRRSVRAGDHVIDAGAHVGLFAMHMAERVGPGGTVHAFEPVESNLECLRAAVTENRFDDRVTVEPAAVGAADGTTSLVFARETLNSGGAYLLRESEPVPEGHVRTPVRVIALDRYPLPRPISFIKIDVEGAEPLALAGASELLRRDKPIVLSEVHPAQLARVANVSPSAFIAQMSRLGYECRLLGAGVAGERVDDVPGNGVTSVVFLPR